MELELIAAIEARLVESGTSRGVRAGDRVGIDHERLVVHQGCGRATPPGLRDAARRLELDDATVTWGVGAGHCQIWLDGGVVHVDDSGSDNGTFIERGGASLRVAGGHVEQLQAGDIVRVGRVGLRVTGGRS